MKLDERHLREWGLGTVSLPESKGKKYFDLVIFNTIKKIETYHPLNSVFEIRP